MCRLSVPVKLLVVAMNSLMAAVELHVQREEPMTAPLHHPHEPSSNAVRDRRHRQYEPEPLRTYTPTQAVLARSAGVFHWTPEGRRLFDFTSGVLVANLGHNPQSWMQRFIALHGLGKPHPSGRDSRQRSGRTAAIPCRCR